MNKVQLKYSACPMRRVMSIIGSKWKPIVIWVLRERTVRFGQLAANIEIISRKVLTTTLQELEADGIVARKEYEGLPPRVDYSLTPKGKALLPLLHQLADWDGVDYTAETASSRSCR
ncbi:winged helix-turn-helix transcriptional regulator [Hymenobacter volaticus]|uniref:Helix-turn-helix transcriptional regulator n=1 Tax=Hymenobacter volaticus TaxID=2932254 RepID=A0ABY4GEE2_9BACT|nr:helix-turn-helix domain-containing protein [Hymenobacter volaticus]UOQ69270.1 helix-turn-helix transcriptional regulator [Hymenobacter volaticus]